MPKVSDTKVKREEGEFFPIRQYVKRTSGLLRAIGNDHEAQAAKNDS
jgi:hypothetical protein